jgi:hypothetical protein
MLKVACILEAELLLGVAAEITESRHLDWLMMKMCFSWPCSHMQLIQPGCQVETLYIREQAGGKVSSCKVERVQTKKGMQLLLLAFLARLRSLQLAVVYLLV